MDKKFVVLLAVLLGQFKTMFCALDKAAPKNNQIETLTSNLTQKHDQAIDSIDKNIASTQRAIDFASATLKSIDGKQRDFLKPSERKKTFKNSEATYLTFRKLGQDYRTQHNARKELYIRKQNLEHLRQELDRLRKDALAQMDTLTSWRSASYWYWKVTGQLPKQTALLEKTCTDFGVFIDFWLTPDDCKQSAITSPTDKVS